VKQVQDFIGGIKHKKVAMIATPLLGNKTFKDDLQLVSTHIADVVKLQGIITVVRNIEALTMQVMNVDQGRSRKHDAGMRNRAMIRF